MSPPFAPLTIAEFRARLAATRWTRRVTAVHMHHTWLPNHAQWRNERDKHDVIVGMWRFHTKENGWSDIAQHLTIAPDGVLWTGRDWNRAPASSGGHNGTSAAGPFMFETIGNFDAGHDRLEGVQRGAVIAVIALVQAQFGLAPETLRFHRQLGSPKTCPGSGIDYAEIAREVAAARLTLTACP